jgi:DNA-binding XRE family transcriptional regulator
MDFAAKVRTMRALRDLSQGRLADEVGISRVWMSAIENGLIPNPEMQERIRAALAPWPPEQVFEALEAPVAIEQA